MAIGARHVGATSEIVSVPDTASKNVSGMPSYTDGVPSYMEPFVGDDYHPKKGTFSPDLLTDTGKAQMASPGKYPPMQVESTKSMEIDVASTSRTVKQGDDPTPIDPLTGMPEGHTVTGDVHFSPDDLVKATLAQIPLLRAMLTELRMQRPQVRANIENSGSNQIASGSPTNIGFSLSKKRVVATKILIQNNGGVDLCVEFDGSAGLGSVRIPTGTTQVYDIRCNNLSLVMASGNAVSLNGQAANNVVVRGWCNPEFTQMRGQA